MWFFYGEETYLIEKELKKIRRNLQITPIFLDESSELAAIISEIDVFSLFEEKKLLYLKNIKAFTNDREAQILISSLAVLSASVEVVFIYNGKLPTKSSLVQYLLVNAKSKKFDLISQNEAISFIKEIVSSKRGVITNGVAIELAEKLPLDLRIIIMEIEKLLHEDNTITSEIVEKSIGDYLKDDYFALANAVSKFKSHEIVSSYQEKLARSEEPTMIISQLFQSLSTAYFVNVCSSQGLTEKEIATKLKIHPFRVKKANELIVNSSIAKIEFLLKELSLVDKNIKFGKIEPKLAMDLFILKLIQ